MQKRNAIKKMDMNRIISIRKARGEPGKRGEGEGKDQGQRVKCREQSDVSMESEAKSQKPKYRFTGRDGPVLKLSTGPPTGSKMIRGAPDWLARGTPVASIGKNKGRGKDGSRGPYARGMPGEWVIAKTHKCVIGYNGQPVTSDQRQATARGKPLQCMNAVEVEGIGKVRVQQPVARGKLPAARGKPHIRPVISTRDEERSATAEFENNRFLPAPGITKGCRRQATVSGEYVFYRAKMA